MTSRSEAEGIGNEAWIEWRAWRTGPYAECYYRHQTTLTGDSCVVGDYWHDCAAVLERERREAEDRQE